MTSLFKRFALAALLSAALAIGLGQPAHTQEAISEAKLESFAHAAMAVNEVIDRWRPQIEAAGSDEQAEAMAEQANAEVRAAVTDTQGITVEEYVQIAEAARADPGLMERINTLITDMAAE